MNLQGAATGRDLAFRSTEVASSISAILGALQFQDITRQRLEHVADSLRALAGELAGITDDDAGVLCGAVLGSILKSVGQAACHNQEIGAARRTPLGAGATLHHGCPAGRPLGGSGAGRRIGNR